jgi:long-chain acyl-CoA synthetase
MTTRPATLRDVLEQSAQQFAGSTSLAMIGGEAMTYAELLTRVRKVQDLLTQYSVRPGDRVALLGENMPNWGVAFFAVTTMGAVAVPILPDFHPSDISNIIIHAEARAVFVSDRLAPKVSELKNGEVVILLESFSVVDSEHRKSNETESPRAPIASDDLASIVYTSGTTGHSKGVMLTHGNLVSDAIATREITAVGPNDRMLSILPLGHTMECTLGLITPVMCGASVHYLDKPPTAAILLPALQAVRPTVMLSVPLIIEKIYKGKVLPELTRTPLLRKLHGVPALRKVLNRIAGRKLYATFGGKLRIFAIGGAALAPDVELFLREAGFPYAIGYGLTETAPLVAGCVPQYTRLRSTGPALPGTQIRILNPDPNTGEGEVVIKGPTVMVGYYRDPERTASVFTDDGWFKSGDLGVMDADGFLYIKGRLKNMILGPSGKNIYPEELETIINEFDSVRESIVFEQQNRLVALIHLDYEKLQQLVHSFGDVDIRGKVKSILDDLHRQVNERVPFHARIHRVVEHLEPFQKTPTQKIKRHLYVS